MGKNVKDNQSSRPNSPVEPKHEPSSKSTTFFENKWGIAGIGLFLILSIFTYIELAKNVVIIEPFKLGERLESIGYSSEGLARKITDHILFIKKETLAGPNLTKAEIRSEKEKYNIKLFEGGMSLDFLIDYLRENFTNNSVHVTGELIENGEKLELTIRVGNEIPGNFTESFNQIPKLLQKAAIYLIQHTNPTLYVQRLLSDGNFQEALYAVRIFVSDAKDDESKSRGYNLWGAILSKQEKCEEAIKFFEKAIGLDSKMSAAYTNMGVCLFRKNKNDEAADKNLLMAIKLDPKESRPRIGLGEVMFVRGNLVEAERYFREATEVNPRDPIAYNNLAEVQKSLKLYQQAIDNYQMALYVNPGWCLPYEGLGSVLEIQKDIQEAIKMYGKYMDTCPNGEYVKKVEEKIAILQKLDPKEDKS